MVIKASAVGAITAPAAPWIARAASSHHSLVASPPRKDAAENSSSPPVNTRRRPSRSPVRPPSSSSPPKVTAYAFTTHSRPLPEKPSARWMCGSATFTIVASSTTISCAEAMTTRARFCLLPSPTPALPSAPGTGTAVMLRLPRATG